MIFSKRIPELDGLRGIAIGMVLVFHYVVEGLTARPGSVFAYIQAACRLTWSGVDLFFVLSGFLIGGILLDARDSTKYFQTFYIRRAFRIIPAYVLLLCASLLFTRFFELPVTGPWFAYFLFINNLWMAKRNSLGFLGFTWSLFVEEQFYLIIPAVVRSAQKLFTIVFCGIGFAFLIRTVSFLHFKNWVAIATLTPCRIDTLLFGVATTLATRDKQTLNLIIRYRFVLWIAVLFLLVGAASYTLHPNWINGIEMASVGFTGLAILYSCVLLLAVTAQGGHLNTILQNTVLRWLGVRAYGLYLWHYVFLIMFKLLLFKENQLLQTVGALMMTLFVAHLSWSYFERPLIKISHRYNY